MSDAKYLAYCMYFVGVVVSQVAESLLGGALVVAVGLCGLAYSSVRLRTACWDQEVSDG